MRVSIITCHHVYNYGASLQAYALQRYLKVLGHDVRIIDYRPEYLSIAYSFWNLPDGKENDKFRNNILLHFLLSLRLFNKRFSTWRRIAPFDRFKRHYLICTDRFSSYKKLADNPPEADVYIAGSDQIWNTNIHNGLDPAFYLRFGDETTKRIAYAASFAMPYLPHEHQSFVKTCLSYFDSVSVRESTGLDILKSIGIKGQIVLDPVFLLSQKQWLDVIGCENCAQGGYVLVYCLNPESDLLFKKANEISKTLGKPVKIVEGIKKVRQRGNVIRNAGPIEFVRLIANAAFVVTDSFHGTAFSIIFERQFAVWHVHSDSCRIIDLLHTLNMEQCINNDSQIITYDWPTIRETINALSDLSKDYIITSLKIA